MTEAGNAAQATGLGERLARARERRGLALLQTAEKLHLEPRVVEALEAEDFDTLGAAVYVRGHLQRYAELVGENAAELQALYAGRPHAHSTPDLTQVITERSRGAAPGARFGVWQGGLLTLALVLAALVWWAVRSSPTGGNAIEVQAPPEETGPTPAAAAPQPAPATARPAAPRAAAAPRTTAAPAAASQAPARPAAPAPRPEHVTAPAPAAAARVGDSAPAPAAAPPPAAATTPAAAPAANAAKLVLRFREDSWAEVYDASGAALYRDIANAGAVQTLSGVPPLRLVLGNAAGVGISLDGRNVTLGATLQSTPNAHFVLERGGRVTETP